MLRFINTLNPRLYYGFRCWIIHVILRQAVDFYDVECINCSMPIGAVETHESYPEIICTMCQSYTTLEAVLADNHEYDDSIPYHFTGVAEPKDNMKAARYVQENTKPRIVSLNGKPYDDRGDYKFPNI